MSSQSYKIVKVLNNNIVLALEGDREKILFARGIGFKRHPGDIVGSGIEIDKVFTIEDKENSDKFREIMTRTDSSIVGLCEEVICMIDNEFDEELDEQIHVSLTDHIAFTLSRLKGNDEIKNPFLIEIETLYKREFETAKKAVVMLEKQTGISIPDGEAGFIALHIHSARNKGKLSNTIKYAFISNSIVKLIEDELHLEVDKKSIDYARFIIHVRFTIERMLNNTPIKNELLETIKRKFKNSYKLAIKAGNIIEQQLNIKVADDEIGYIALHIEKLKNAS